MRHNLDLRFRSPVRETQIPRTRKYSKITKMTPKAHPQNYLAKTQKLQKKSIFEEFLVFFEYFSGNFGDGPLGSFLVIFEYFRVRGIWVSLTGALNRKSGPFPKKVGNPLFFGNSQFLLRFPGFCCSLRGCWNMSATETTHVPAKFFIVN